MSHARDYFPVPGEGGRPIKVNPDEIETVLWVLAMNGGSATRAAVQLYEQHGWKHITRENIRDWARGRFRARYEEICTDRARDLEETAARGAMDLVMQIKEQEQAAVRRVAAGLANANGVEASMILRNLTQAKVANLEKAGQVRGRAGFVAPEVNVVALMEGLARLGAGFEFVDSDAEELTEVPEAAG